MSQVFEVSDKILSEDHRYIDLGDVFDDERDMCAVDEVAWKKLKEARLKEGFADGKYLGEESMLQYGFDHGYSEGYQLSFPISVIQGLLEVAKMQISKSQPSLALESHKIQHRLKRFKENMSDKKLGCIVANEFLDNDDILDDLEGNSSKCTSISSMKSFNDCYFSDKNKEQVKNILDEFCNLKESVLRFFSDCNQPFIMERISQLCEEWQVQQVARLNLCETKCTCDNKPSYKRNLLVTS